MSIISPELVIIVWHDLGDMINGQMKETVKDFKLTVFLQVFYNKIYPDIHYLFFAFL